MVAMTLMIIIKMVTMIDDDLKLICFLCINDFYLRRVHFRLMLIMEPDALRKCL